MPWEWLGPEAPMTSPLLQAQGVQKRQGERQRWQAPGIDLEPGERLGLSWPLLLASTRLVVLLLLVGGVLE